MQVLAPGASGGELVGDEGREVAGIVVPLGSLHDLLPGTLDDAEIEQVVGVDVAPFARQHFLEHRAAVRRRRGAPQRDREWMLAHCRVRVVHLLEHAQVGGVVGDRQEVERRLEAHLDTGRVRQRLALGVSVGVVGVVAGAEDVGVERVLGVYVNVAEVGVAYRPALGAVARTSGFRRCGRVAGWIRPVWAVTGAGDGQDEQNRQPRDRAREREGSRRDGRATGKGLGHRVLLTVGS